MVVRTTIDIDQQTHRLAKAIAAQKGISMGKVVAEAIRKQWGPEEPKSMVFGKSEAGFTTIDIGRPITSEEVAELIAEDD